MTIIERSKFNGPAPAQISDKLVEISKANNFLTTIIDSLNEAALKNIHAKLTNQNVIKILYILSSCLGRFNLPIILFLNLAVDTPNTW